MRHAKWNIGYKLTKTVFVKLEKLGLVEQSGINSIKDAKKSGLWNFKDDVDALIKPDDLVKCLKDYTPALACFEAFSKSNKRFILRWIKLAKTDVNRQKRILETVTLAQKGEKIKGL